MDVVERLEVDHDQVVAWVRASCEAQGLPEKVTDPVILRKVAVLLRPALAGSPMPKRRYSRRVKPVAPADGGVDANVVEDGGDNAALSGQRETGPIAAKGRWVGEVATEDGSTVVDVEGGSS